MMIATAAASVNTLPRAAFRIYIPFEPKCISSFFSSADPAEPTRSARWRYLILAAPRCDETMRTKPRVKITYNAPKGSRQQSKKPASCIRSPSIMAAPKA